MMMDFKDKNQIYQLIAGISGFTVILIGCLVIMKPFFPSILLATLLTLATWPAFTWLNHRLRHRPNLSAFLMTCFLAGFFIFPVVIIGGSITDNFDKIYSAVQHSLQNNTEETAKTLETVPYVGTYLGKAWTFVAADKERLSAALQEYAAPTSQKLISLGGSIGRGLL